MSLAVLNVGGTPAANINSGLLADINLTSQQSVQIEQILAELQTGIISPVEARAQIAGIVAQQASSGSGGASAAPSHQATPVANGSPVSGNVASDPQQSFYELPLPQESLKGAVSSYTATGAAAQTVFSAPQIVNHAA